ncbi:MAG: hypothetical protein KC495_13800 [Dehalococcoidia bacterium]|nr:hypothetical protein [Dehalococcoidia bacterium]
MRNTTTSPEYLGEPGRLDLARDGRNVWDVPFSPARAGIPCGCGCGSWDVPSGSAFDRQCLARIQRGAVR